MTGPGKVCVRVPPCVRARVRITNARCVCAEQRYFACLPMHGVFVRPTKVTERDVPVPVEAPMPERVVKPAAAAAAEAGAAAASKTSDAAP